MLVLDPKLSLRRLATRESLVAPTLVQHFKLLKLVPEIQSFLATQQNPAVLRFLSLRRLMTLADLAASEQRRIFRVWQTEFGLDLGLPAVASSLVKKSVRAIRPG